MSIRQVRNPKAEVRKKAENAKSEAGSVVSQKLVKAAAIPCQGKAAEDSRTPRRFAMSGTLERARAFWSAAVLCRFPSQKVIGIVRHSTSGQPSKWFRDSGFGLPSVFGFRPSDF